MGLGKVILRKLKIMQKLLILSVAAMLLFAGTSCKKLLVYGEEHGVPYIIPDTRIAYIAFGGFEGLDSATILYNAAGNPTYAIRRRPATGAPSFVMRYDASGRLSDLIGTYDTAVTNVESWSKFSYDDSGNIVSNTCIAFPTIVNGQPTVALHGTLIMAKYEYDSRHRLIQDSDWVVGSGPFKTVNFSYDSTGNMTGVGHDNKINFNRTNKYWQFLNQDYSVNNPTSATYTYNASGLPVTVTGGGKFIITPVEYMFELSSSTIHYQ